MQIEQTRQNVKDASSKISGFTSRGRLPCPSNRALAPGNANFGMELGQAALPTAADIANLPACTGAMQGICRTLGPRDTDADPDNLPDPIIIGGIPVQTMRNLGRNIKHEETQDAWGNQLTYAVSARLCQTPPDPTNRIYMHRRGVIRAVDEYGNQTAGIGTRDLTPDGILDVNDSDAQFVILSHGEAGVGAYSIDGAAATPCVAGTREAENCDNDFTFMSALSSFKAQNNDYFDDIIYFHLYIQNDLWETVNILDPDGVAVPTVDIRNLNDNNVGILTDTPQERLHVNGNINADSANVTIVCNRAGDRCFNYDFLRDSRTVSAPDPITLNPTVGTGGKINTCPTGQVITAIGNNTVACGRPTLQAPGAVRNCSGLTPYLRGILSNGEPICTN